METLLNLMNQANPNSEGLAPISAKLSNTHMVSLTYQIVFSMLLPVFYIKFFESATETELPLPLPPLRTPLTPETSTFLYAEFSTPRFLGTLARWPPDSS